MLQTGKEESTQRRHTRRRRCSSREREGEVEGKPFQLVHWKESCPVKTFSGDPRLSLAAGALLLAAELQPLCPGGGLRKISFFYCEGGQMLEQAAQRGCAVSILGDSQKPSAHGLGNQL